MLVTRKSHFSGKINSMEIPADPDKIAAYLGGQVRELIQNYFPELNADQREFLMTGCTPEEWNAMFPVEDDE